MRVINVTVPVKTDDQEKIVPIEAKVSDGTIDHEGKAYHLVKHAGSGFQYLATPSTVDSLEDDELVTQMDQLATEEGM
tara:strand:+ start:1655 stop:1888 length:234 start_codon:yes stop_codon:yes gene_type:complete